MLRTSSGTQSLYIYDGGGSPVALITDAGIQGFSYTYDPYGVPVLSQNSGGSGVGQNPYTFAGGVQDRTTGWIHYYGADETGVGAGAAAAGGCIAGGAADALDQETHSKLGSATETALDVSEIAGEAA